MIEWLGIDRLFELCRTDAIAGFFTPLAIFAAFLLAQLILPARRVPGYVINQETGKPRKYRLNGILIFGHFGNPWAWTYFVVIVTLFTFRQRVDDKHCAEKYGAEKWAAYKARVKYRICPGIY